MVILSLLIVPTAGHWCDIILSSIQHGHHPSHLVSAVGNEDGNPMPEMVSKISYKLRNLTPPAKET